MANARTNKRRYTTMLLGVGLDSDGHKRLTAGPNFVLAGGAEETHQLMTEKVLKINEKLKAADKQLDNISGEEFDEIAQSVGLCHFKPKSG